MNNGKSPKGTLSFCEYLLADPTTAHFVGKPTHFFSHAWANPFANEVAALESFVASLPEGSPEAFFWFDCCSIDQHACQYGREGRGSESPELVHCSSARHSTSL